MRTAWVHFQWILTLSEDVHIRCTQLRVPSGGYDNSERKVCVCVRVEVVVGGWREDLFQL